MSENPTPTPPSSNPSSWQPDGNTCYRVLVVDDKQSIHDDFRKILCPVSAADRRSDELESLIFDRPAKTGHGISFHIDSAFQGEVALEMLEKAIAEDRPYALAFVDIQMPPGWDGVETVNRLWEAYPALQVVICTAYSTYSWEDMHSLLKKPDSLLILKKPFDKAEIQQMAHTLARKWELNLLAGMGLERLDGSIRKLLTSKEGSVSDLAEPLPAHPNERQFVVILERLSQTLEATRSQLRDAEQRLVHSEKMATLGQMSAGILHEINNPLNYAMAALTMLEVSGERLPDEHLDSLKDIRDGLSRMMNVTLDLGKFAHAESGGLRKVEVNDAVRTALRLMAADIGDSITIENRISEDVIISGTASRLSQVFINLIHNSTYALRRKVQPAGEVPRILFEATVEKERTIISVTDNGTGISPEQIGKIFDAFYTTKEVGQGVGLGLGICDQILQQFGATFSVESEPGIYTRFDMTFPAPAH